jgi:hypothetical protein
MNTTTILAALTNASDAAEAAYQANSYPLMVAAYVRLMEVAAAAYNNNHFFIGEEATEMARDLTYCF